MASFWDEVKNQIKKWSGVAAEKAEEFGKVAATKTEELTKVSKIRLELHQLQRDLGRKYNELGKLVFNKTNVDNVTSFAGNEQFFTMVNDIQEMQSRVKSKEEKIEEIKKEYQSKGDQTPVSEQQEEEQKPEDEPKPEED